MTSVIFDLDGVIYRGYDTLPHAVECVKSLRTSGIKTGFLTNNSGRSCSNYVDVLTSIGIPIDPSEIMTSGEATARHLLKNGYKGTRAYVVGGDGLVETLIKSGFEVDTGDEGDKCGLVVVGWARNINFNKITRAQHEIFTNGATFIATNTDAMFPAQGGKILPGAGSMVAAIGIASVSTPEVIGKPATISLEYLLDALNSRDDDPETVWFVGDRLDTDIACGNAYGTNTVLVTTGISSREMSEGASGLERPDHIIDSLDELHGLVHR